MTRVYRLALASAAVAIVLAGEARATILIFGGTPNVPANNTDLAVNYGSNKGVADADFLDGGEGMTPNIALTWAPTGGVENQNQPNADVLELHSAATFTNPAGPAFTAPVLQLDVDASNHAAGFIPVRPTVDFVPDAGYGVKIHEFKIGNATDQTATELPHPWTIRIRDLSTLTELASFTTISLGAGTSQIVSFDYTGALNQSLRLEFSDGDSTLSVDHYPRTAIDNLRFSQVVPEPSTIGLIVTCALALLPVSRRSR